MVMLGARDRLAVQPRRIVVAGPSGAGKTTLARRIAEVIGADHVEMDALRQGPNWTRRPTFRADVEDLVAREAWVTEWQYSEVRPLVAGRADVMVWLDLPRVRVMPQVVRRTLRRRLRREVLYNGNVEPPLRTIFTDDEHIIRWAWASVPRIRGKVLDLAAASPELPIVRLRSHAEAEAWLAGPLRAACG